MLDWLRRIAAPPVFASDEDKSRVAAQLNLILWSFMGIVLSVGIATPFVFSGQMIQIMTIIVVMVLMISGMLFLMHRGQVQLAGGLFSVGMWLLYGGLVVAGGGMTTPFVLLWVVNVVMAGLLLGGQAAIVLAGLSAVAGLGILVAERQGVLPPPLIKMSAVGGWAMLVAFLSIATVLLYLTLRGLGEALGNARRYAAELEEQRSQLEKLVAERTRELARRSNYLEASTAVAREAAATLDLQRLLPQVAHLISERFECYHTGIFMLDATRQWAVLQAASGEGGQRMLARGHRLKVGSQSIVGYATGRGVPRIALDVGADASFLNNPDLPETRSEIALPLKARGQVIGALDMQSVKVQAFGEEDIAVLQTLADQVALAINNAQLFEQAQAAIEVERRAAGELTGQAWQQLRAQSKRLNYLRNRDGLAAVQDLQIQATEQVKLDQAQPNILAVPIKVRDQVIGVIHANRPAGSGQWTPDQIALVETLIEQMGVALESARLYQDTQRRAAREQLTREITDNIRSAISVEDALQRAIRELGRALGAEMVARIGTEDELLPTERKQA